MEDVVTLLPLPLPRPPALPWAFILLLTLPVASSPLSLRPAAARGCITALLPQGPVLHAAHLHPTFYFLFTCPPRCSGNEGLYHCDYCHKDLSSTLRIKCAVCKDFDLCLECFR